MLVWLTQVIRKKNVSVNYRSVALTLVDSGTIKFENMWGLSSRVDGQG